MEKIILSVEETVDISNEELDRMGVKHIPLNYRNETTGEDNPKLSVAEFYSALRSGESFKTSLINEFEFSEYFSELVKEGSVIHLGFSGGLSGTNKSAQDAAEKINLTSKNKVYVVDSLTGSGAQAILLRETLKRLKEGKTAEELVEFANEFKTHLCLNFSPEDLKTLAKSGRCNKVVAVLGTILNIKPIVYCNDEGKFSIRQKVISRKKALTRMDELFKEKYNFLSEYVYILHGDKYADAKFIKDEILKDERFKSCKIIVDYLGIIVGAHGGPGNICMCFTTDKKN